MNENKKFESLTSHERIKSLIDEAKEELEELAPEIEYLEECINKLNQLREKETKLKTLILSLSRLVDIDLIDTTSGTLSSNDLKCSIDTTVKSSQSSVANLGDKNDVERNHFYPDRAMAEVRNFLRTKNNLNYEIFKAVVINSGIATTEQIKIYLIENNIKQPQSGKGFEQVELKEISSRANYLVRKKLLETVGSGLFKSVYGWN